MTLVNNMPVTCPGEYEVNGKKVILDEDCFLQNPEVWDEKVAEWMAKNLEGVQQMTERHWKVVRYLRQYWETYGVCPPIKMLLKETGETLEAYTNYSQTDQPTEHAK